MGGLDSEGRRGRWSQVTSWNTQARPTSPPAAGLRDPPPETAPGPPRAACFHDNRTSLAWAARETPRAGPAASARAPRPGASPPTQPPRLGVPDATERPQPQLLAQPSLTSNAACRRRRRIPTRLPPPPLARARVPDPRMARRLLPAAQRTGAVPRGRGPVGGASGRGRWREDRSASSTCGQPETRSGPRKGAGPRRDEPLAQWTRVRPEGAGASVGRRGDERWAGPRVLPRPPNERTQGLEGAGPRRRGGADGGVPGSSTTCRPINRHRRASKAEMGGAGRREAGAGRRTTIFSSRGLCWRGRASAKLWGQAWPQAGWGRGLANYFVLTF